VNVVSYVVYSIGAWAAVIVIAWLSGGAVDPARSLMVTAGLLGIVCGVVAPVLKWIVSKRANRH